MIFPIHLGRTEIASKFILGLGAFSLQSSVLDRQGSIQSIYLILWCTVSVRNCCNIRSGTAATIRVLRVRRMARGHATRPVSMWNRKRQHPATIAGGARANPTEGSEPRPSHRKRRQERQRPPRAATAPDGCSKCCDVQTRTAEEELEHAQTQESRWKSHAIGAEGGTHLETVDSKMPFITRVRSEVIWPECAAQRERKAQLQVGVVMAENSRSALESETRSPASEQEAYTLLPVNSQRASPIEVSVTVDGVPMTMELDTGACSCQCHQ